MQHKLRFDSIVAVNRVFTKTTVSGDFVADPTKLQDRVTSKNLGKAKSLIGKMADPHGKTFAAYPQFGKAIGDIRSNLESYNVSQGHREIVEQSIASIGRALARGDGQTAARRLNRLQGQVSSLISNAIINDVDDRNEQVGDWLKNEIYDITGHQDTGSQQLKAAHEAITNAMAEYGDLKEEHWMAANESVKESHEVQKQFKSYGMRRLTTTKRSRSTMILTKTAGSKTTMRRPVNSSQNNIG